MRVFAILFIQLTLLLDGVATLAASTDCAGQLIAIVDPYSQGLNLLKRAKEQGFKVVRVQSKSEVPVWAQKDHSKGSEFSDQTIVHSGDMQATSALLEQLGVTKIIAGSELGVLLSDALSHQLKLPETNPFELTEARRLKPELSKALERNGLRSIRGTEAHSVDDILTWMQKTGQAYPIILKPAAASASEGVKVCENEAEVREHFLKLHLQKNADGDLNLGVLAQEIMQGTIYRVDTVSQNGSHLVGFVWKYSVERVPGAGYMYEHVDLVSPSELPENLLPYSLKVLDAIGIQYGAAHSEIWINQNGEAVAMDVGARIGGGLPKVSEAATGFNQFDAVLEAYTSLEKFSGRQNQNYTPRKSARSVFLNSHSEGTHFSTKLIAAVRRLESYYEDDFPHLEGDLLPLTRDLDTYLGRVQLLHSDPKVIQRDYEWLKAQLDAGAFTTEAPKNSEARVTGGHGVPAIIHALTQGFHPSARQP